MEEMQVWVTAATATAATVGAFWLRTEAVRESLREWVVKEYMTREAVNLKFDAIQSGLLNLGTRVDSIGARMEGMERRQRVQIQFLERIESKLSNNKGKIILDGDDYESKET